MCLPARRIYVVLLCRAGLSRAFDSRRKQQRVFVVRARVFPPTFAFRRFDNFRFVEHRRLRGGGAEALALSALAEVPNQYRAIRALRLMPGEGLAPFLVSCARRKGAPVMLCLSSQGGGSQQAGGVLIDMHGRNRVTVDPRTKYPYNAGTEHVGFFTDQADITCTKREAKPKGFGESHEG